MRRGELDAQCGSASIPGRLARGDGRRDGPHFPAPPGPSRRKVIPPDGTTALLTAPGWRAYGVGCSRSEPGAQRDPDLPSPTPPASSPQPGRDGPDGRGAPHLDAAAGHGLEPGSRRIDPVAAHERGPGEQWAARGPAARGTHHSQNRTCQCCRAPAPVRRRRARIPWRSNVRRIAARRMCCDGPGHGPDASSDPPDPERAC